MDNYVDVEAVLRETDDSILVKVAETEASVIAAEDCADTREVWVPKSQIEEDSEVQEKGDEGTLIVTEWLARERGW